MGQLQVEAPTPAVAPAAKPMSGVTVSAKTSSCTVSPKTTTTTVANGGGGGGLAYLDYESGADWWKNIDKTASDANQEKDWMDYLEDMDFSGEEELTCFPA